MADRRMRLFISWSGEPSRMIAEELRTWIPDVIQGVETYVSSTEIRKGKRWPQELAGALEDFSYGIICLTPHNLNATWIYFEAGALSKFLNDDFIAPILFGVQSIEAVPDPLRQFQVTKFEKADMLKLMQAVNENCEPSMDEAQLTRVFNRNWTSLNRKIRPILNKLNEGKAEERQITAEESPILNEILDLARSQQRAIDRATGDPYHTYRGNSRLEPLSPGDFRQLAVGLAMLKNLADTEAHDWHMPEGAILRTMFMLRDPLEVILARGFAPHIGSLYFDDERGPLRITYTEGERQFDEEVDNYFDDEEDTKP